jgi:diguanylate cyclase (GGDEF)-like protein
VHEQGRTQDRLTYLADHDSLTGLVNRRVLGERLTRDFRAGTDLVLLYLDLDGFKAVNDRHGHAAGDQVLIEVARRIRAEVRDGDLVARLGGDEFAVLCPGLDPAAARELVKRLCRVVSEPIPGDGPVLQVGASIGVATAAGCAHGDDLLSRADAAMFEIKRERRAADPAPAQSVAQSVAQPVAQPVAQVDDARLPL